MSLPLEDHLRTNISSIAEAEILHAQLLNGAARTAAWLHDFAGEPMALLKALRVDLVGHDPLTGGPLNVVEQLNQTFTILVTLRAIERLLELHPEAGAFRLALEQAVVGTSRVLCQIMSQLRYFWQPVLTATTSWKNLLRLSTDPGRHLYVFFASPEFAAGRHERLETVADVQVYAVSP